jgi:hypothetical protein
MQDNNFISFSFIIASVVVMFGDKVFKLIF